MRKILFLWTIILCAGVFAACNPSNNNAPYEAVAGEILDTPSPRPIKTLPPVTPTPTPPTLTTPSPTPEVLPETPVPVKTPKPVELPDDVRSPYAKNYPPAVALSDAPNDKLDWYYMRNSEHQPPTAQQKFDIRLYGSHYLGDISRKVLYLTFDMGYENGFTPTILDILKEKEVPAAFFMTQTYIRDNIDLATRIAEEGHVAANHSVRHKSFPTLTDSEIEEELQGTARYFEEVTGYTLAPFFRPPDGQYSVRTLALAQLYGYETVFWSFAHVDWLRDEQPGKETTYTRVMDNLHNGEILLLHAISQSNTEALPDIIDAARALGYTFDSLYNLE